MEVTKSIFKSQKSEIRWVELQKEKSDLQKKKQTSAIIERIENINSLMTSCKVGFNISEARVKKIIKFLKEKTGKEKVKYGAIPEELEKKKILFKDALITYTEKEGLVIFKEK